MKEPTPLMVALSDDRLVDLMEEAVTDKTDRELCEMSGWVFTAVGSTGAAISEAVRVAMGMRVIFDG